MKLILASALALAGSALAGASSSPRVRKDPGLLTGCPNGYADFETGECKPYHLRVRDAEAGEWQSHKVTHAYPVVDWPHDAGNNQGQWGPPDGRKDNDGKGKDHGPWGKPYGHGKPGGPSDHCPNGVAFHATGECRPFRVHARDADSGEWKGHKVTGMYRIPDERPGKGGPQNGHGGPTGGHGGPQQGGHGGPQFGGQHGPQGQHGPPAGKPGPGGQKNGMFGGPKGGHGGPAGQNGGKFWGP